MTSGLFSCKVVAFAIILTLIQNAQHQNKVNCSSYLDDYFLPTAKIALNKIQQSLSPSSFSNNNNQPLTQISAAGNNQTIDLQITGASNGEQPGEHLAESKANPEFKSDPNEPPSGKSIKLPEDSILQQQTTSERPTTESISETSTPTETSSSAASNTDSSTETKTTTTTTTESDSTSSSQESVVSQAANDEQVSAGSSEPLPVQDKKSIVLDSTSSSLVESSTTTTTTTTETSNNIEQKPVAIKQSQLDQNSGTAAVLVESKSADEASIRETELEAVAAVDASIGFGGDLFGSQGDSCYDEYANARFCEPEFENVAFERQVEVSSECGLPPSRFCTAYLNERHEQIRNCHICDSQHPKKRHPAAYLTDMNNSNSPTCWVSAPIINHSAPVNATTNQQQTQVDGDFANSNKDNVTLILNLDKKYEIVYISMQFCSMKPDSLAIYKSMDYGRNWIPYQFYSSQCRKMYDRTSNTLSQRSSLVRPQTGSSLSPEASCLNSSQLGNNQQQSSGRIAFSTLDGRSSVGGGGLLERSQLLQDWITATNIKIVLDRHQASWIHSNLVHPHHAHQLNHHHQQAATKQHQQTSPKNDTSTSPETMPQAQAFQQQQQHEPSQLQTNTENSLTSPSDTFNYAMSDLTVGGRCKCNGHASRCIHSKEGKLQCDCRHNTAGRDCEKCAPFHFDRPWARATQLDANPCQPCNCNGHSRKCRFDAEIYRLSGQRSGGVCIGCRDNTAGRHCHYCKEGFTRDHSKPMSDKEACKHCDCHPIGSLGRACNLTTGQCQCKEGVTGLQCNRCAPGYQQSSSLTDPCIKLPDNENDIHYYPLTVDGDERSSSTSEQQPPPTAAVESDQPPLVAPSGGASRTKIESTEMDNNNGQELDIPNITGSINSQQQQQQQQDGSNKDETSEGSSLLVESAAESPTLMSRANKHSHRQPYWQQHPSMHSVGTATNTRKQQPYYGYHPIQSARNHHHLYQQQTGSSGSSIDQDQEEDQDSDSDLDDQQPQQPANRRNGRPMLTANDEMNGAYLTPDMGYYYPAAHNIYNPKGRYNAQEYNGRRRPNQQHSRHRTPPDMIMHPASSGVSNLMDNGGDEMNELDRPTQNNNYQQNSIYSMQEEAFNQIQPTPSQMRRLSTSRNRIQSAPNRFNGGGNRFGGGGEQPVIMATGSEVVCGDCQLSSRRLSSRQFCHLQFAIRATILNKYMADDWTRFEVEIQDIFKSQPSITTTNSVTAEQQVLPQKQVVGSAVALDNMLQADDPLAIVNSQQIKNNNNNGTIEAVADSVIDQQAAVYSPPPQTTTMHRIKVGTIQSIWVPTEDLTCKCPKLKLRATYLLMGSIELKENSANTLQLDRHGVALEWKSSLQEKMMRYQRRLSRGKC